MFYPLLTVALRRLVPAVAGVAMLLSWTGCAGLKECDPMEDCMAAMEGKVQVLLLGMKGCEATEEATRFLADYHGRMPEGAGIARIDVPAPGQSARGVSSWEEPFPYALDRQRKLAAGLEFFFYPTLYILDRDGEVRYAGPCDKARVPEVVLALLAEEEDREKNSYSPVMLKPGEKAPPFSGPSLEGKDLALSALQGKKATLLLFSTPTCPFSAEAVTRLPDLQTRFAKEGVAAVIVNQAGTVEEVGRFYRENAPKIPVIVDEKGDIGYGEYGVLGVPFYYLLDGEGRVVERLPFTEEAAQESIMAHLEGRASNARKLALAGAG